MLIYSSLSELRHSCSSLFILFLSYIRLFIAVFNSILYGGGVVAVRPHPLMCFFALYSNNPKCSQLFIADAMKKNL